MGNGWFDAFRENGGPTWYGENRTPATADSLTVTIVTIFLILYVAFLVVFPGIRREKWTSFFAVTVSLYVGAVILLCIHHPAWHCGEVRTLSPYRSFSNERVDAVLGVNFGLTVLNITLKGAPENRPHDHMNYNERFQFAEVRSMERELKTGRDHGLPYPILSVLEYLSVDRAGFVWGRHYRLAGYYTYIILWTAFALWLIMIATLGLVPQMFSRVEMAVGGVLWLANVVYALTIPRNFVIPLSGIDDTNVLLRSQFCWCFWLTMVTGGVCLVMGLIIRLLERFRKGYTFGTFLQVDTWQLEYAGFKRLSAEPKAAADGGSLHKCGSGGDMSPVFVQSARMDSSALAGGVSVELGCDYTAPSCELRNRSQQSHYSSTPSRSAPQEEEPRAYIKQAWASHSRLNDAALSRPSKSLQSLHQRCADNAVHTLAHSPLSSPGSRGGEPPVEDADGATSSSSSACSRL